MDKYASNIFIYRSIDCVDVGNYVCWLLSLTLTSEFLPLGIMGMRVDGATLQCVVFLCKHKKWHYHK
jgi:hypothetical protein